VAQLALAGARARITLAVYGLREYYIFRVIGTARHSSKRDASRTTAS